MKVQGKPMPVKAPMVARKTSRGLLDELVTMGEFLWFISHIGKNNQIKALSSRTSSN